jgi:hypothetical protein
VARAEGVELGEYRIVPGAHSHAAAEKAGELARAGEVEALMKGSLHTDELMGAVVPSAAGMPTSRRISHVFVMDVTAYPRMLLITDAAINIAPGLEEKVDIVQNAIDLAHVLGIDQPRVAILSAVETVTSKIESTIQAAALCKMADRGQIQGAVLDGPLAFDNAISAAAAPQLPQVACFDTSFHRTQPAVAQLFALPRRYIDEGVRRYGFHGLSYEYVASVLPGIDAGAARGRTVVAAHQRSGQPRDRPGDPHQRGADDRPAHPALDLTTVSPQEGTPARMIA